MYLHTCAHSSNLNRIFCEYVNLSNNEKYTKAGLLWQQLGGSWGGNTIDEYWHFELDETHSLSKKQKE